MELTLKNGYVVRVRPISKISLTCQVYDKGDAILLHEDLVPTRKFYRWLEAVASCKA